VVSATEPGAFAVQLSRLGYGNNAIEVLFVDVR
jgi:hypothetical protein